MNLPVRQHDAIQPLYIKVLPESSDLESAMVSPDGKSIWAVVDAPMIDVGKLINQNALTLASILAGVASLLLLVWAYRAAHRRRTVGAMHCRRCDYEVAGVAASQTAPICTECGLDLRRRPPRPGRTRFRRLALPVTAALLVVGSFTWFLTVGRAAYPKPAPEGRWGSTTLQRWSSTPWLTWLNAASERGDLLLELDTESGVTRRLICARPTRTFFHAVYNPAAKAVYLQGPDGIDLVGVDSGRTIATLRGEEAVGRGSTAPLIAGHGAGGGTVYLNGAASDGASSWLVEWDWRTGKHRRIAQAPGWKGQAYPSPAHHTVIPGTPLRLLRYTDFGEAFQTKHYRLTLLDDKGTVLKEADLGERVNPMSVPSFSSDGALVFLPGPFSGVVALDASSLQQVDRLSTRTSTDRATVRPDGRLMLIPGHRQIEV
ncbi:MAG TPA: hypothetical protein VFF65_06915, partial [Phycisphaerales bacterium]|nr:hypothetical protein [Phycisphaerales bacterium]